MSTIFRQWSYEYPWVYQTVSWCASLSVGGMERLYRLFLRDIDLQPSMSVLDLCCGAGPLTRILLEFTPWVTGLDASPKAIDRARAIAPQAQYVVSLAEKMPLANQQFDLVVTHTAFHEMTTSQLQDILAEVYRVLKPQGKLIMIDFHPPTNPLFWLPLSLFLYLFETETAWELLRIDWMQFFPQQGFRVSQQRLYAGGSLQVLTVCVP